MAIIIPEFCYHQLRHEQTLTLGWLLFLPSNALCNPLLPENHIQQDMMEGMPLLLVVVVVEAVGVGVVAVGVALGIVVAAAAVILVVHRSG